MDNAQKAIMIGVGLFITIIIISVVLLITNLGTGMVDDARDNLGNMSASLTNTLISSYDYKAVSGADIQSLYVQYKDSDEMLLVIENNVGDTYTNRKNGSDFIIATVAGRYAIDSLASTGAALYPTGFSTGINSADRYRTYVIRSSTDADVIIGVYADKL